MQPIFSFPRPASRSSTRAFSLPEILVGCAVVLVLLAIGIPVYTAKQRKAYKAVALDKIRTVGAATTSYASQNSDMLPEEDAEGNDTWQNATQATAKDAWYNALPRLIGRKGVGDYANAAEAFYTDENILFLPGGNYPDKKKFIDPMFAYAFNTKLQRTDPSGKKERTKLGQITQQAKTVILLEQGLLNESRTLPFQTKKDYDGSPKGSAKSFVGRYNGQGVLYFADGHAEFVYAKDLLTESGQFPFPQTNVIWTITPEENPNKDGQQKSKEKSKN